MIAVGMVGGSWGVGWVVRTTVHGLDVILTLQKSAWHVLKGEAGKADGDEHRSAAEKGDAAAAYNKAKEANKDVNRPVDLATFFG